MIAAQDYRDHPGVVDLFHPFAYLLVALLDVSGDDGDVAVVDDREVLEDRDVLGGVVGPKEVRDAPYPLGTEAGPRAEGGAGVEGRAHDGGVGVVEVLRVGQPHEGPDARKARRLEGINRLVVGHVRLLLSLEVAHLEVADGLVQDAGDEPHVVLVDDQGRCQGYDVVESGHRVAVLADYESPLLAAGYHARHLLRRGGFAAVAVLDELYPEKEALVPHLPHVRALVDAAEFVP